MARAKSQAPKSEPVTATVPDGENDLVGVTPEEAGAALLGALEGQPDPDDDATEVPPAGEPDDDEIAGLEEALGEREPETSGEGAAADPGELPEDLAGLADRLEVEAKDLYSIKVPLGGELGDLSIGDLKDAYHDQAQHATDREQWEITRQEEATELEQGRQQLALLTSKIPAEMRTPQMLEAAAAELETFREEQTAALLQRVPEWKDQTRYTADQEVMLEQVKRYGFTKADLDSVVDHRLQAYIRDMALREQRLREQLEAARARKTNKAQRRSAEQNSGKADKPGRRRSRTDEAVAGVAGILTGTSS